MALDPISGLAEGWLSTKKTSGRDTGNGLALSAEDDQLAKNQLGDLLRYQGSNAALDPLESSRIATKEVQNNGILGGLFGSSPDSVLNRTNTEEKNLASRGFSLKPEDYEAYGQASDNIARQFGSQEGNLAQSLSDRGLSNSGSAATSFSGLQGSKMEQLGQMQRQIANDRMQSNMARLGQTRNFLSQMGQQGENAIQGQYGRQMDSEKARFGELASKNDAAQSRLMAQANQGNENLMQRMATEGQSPWAKTAQGGLSGMQNGSLLMAQILSGGKGGAGQGMQSSTQDTTRNKGGLGS